MAPKFLGQGGSNEAAYWNLILAAMEEVVHGERGTARAIGPRAYRMAGKTGTAQVFAIAQEEEYEAEGAGRTAARPCPVHRLRAGR